MLKVKLLFKFSRAIIRLMISKYYDLNRHQSISLFNLSKVCEKNSVYNYYD